MANEAVVEDENEGTILTFDDAENVSVEDIMYLLQGTGSNRDRKISLGALIAFLVANQKFTELKLVKDSENDISIKWDSTHSEFVIWERTNTDGHVVAVPKLHVHGTLEVEKDVTLKSDVYITKTLTVDLQTTLHQLVLMNNGAVVKNGLDSRGRAKFERPNINSDKCSFTVSTDSDINLLLQNSGIDPIAGDIVTIYNERYNESNNDVTITIGYRQGYGGDEYKTMSISSLCAMSFICRLHQVTPLATYYDWAPLGNTAVTWA